MKKYFSGLVTGLMVGLSVTVFANVPGIKSAVYTEDVAIEVDGIKQSVEVVSVIKSDEEWARNYVSVGDLAPVLGGEVVWNGETQTVEIKTGDTGQEIQAAEEWLSFREFTALSGKGVKFDGKILEIFEDETNQKLILKIDYENNTTNIRTQMQDSRLLLNKADLIKEGLIKE